MALFNKEFLSKAKDAVSSAADKAKNAVDAAKANHEQKKAEQEQYRLEMEAKAAEKAAQIMQAIRNFENAAGLFDGIDAGNLTAFTKEFCDKILLPAHSVGKSNLTMLPHITDKMLEKFQKTVPAYVMGETALVHLKVDANQSFVLTEQALYFCLALEEDAKFHATGRIPCDQIGRFSVAKTDSTYEFKCDEFVLAAFAADKATAEDFITLDNYFSSIAKRDFVITDEEVDALIQKKIGEKVYAEVKKYLVYDDELLVYFAWGLDSLSAKDYMVCTTKQIIMVNREMFGATANIKQFYYEDITSASIDQNAKSNDLTVALIETALTAATKTCDLIITVAGAATRIDTLYKIEAERIVAVYHQYRKLAKTAAAQPQVQVVQQPDVLEQVKKLAEMKELGILSEEEFAQKKADLLAKI